MNRDSIIHTSDNVLVIVEELVFIYHLIDVSRHDYLNTMETLQCSRTTKRGKEANDKRHQKSAKKNGALSEYCQIHNRNTEY